MNKRKVTYAQAINESLTQEMERDNKVFVCGPDVGDHRRIYGTTSGLVEKFGTSRCLTCPLSEEMIMGFCLGAAINGLRPVFVNIRVDFVLLAMNQLINMVSVHNYGSNGQKNTPIVIRAQIGRGLGQGFQHSKSIQSVFAHFPGLKVIMPTTAYDMKGMLTAAIRDNNPVIVLEHRWLYDLKGFVPKKPYTVPIGKSKITRQGNDVTVVTTSWLNFEAEQAADILLKKAGISLELIDIRSVSPLDSETIIRSVKKTRNCVIADYDWVNCGLSSEIAAIVSERCFGELKKPVVRIGFAPTPCPTSRHLEDKFYPNASTIIKAVEKILGIKPIDLSGERFYNYENYFKGPF